MVVSRRVPVEWQDNSFTHMGISYFSMYVHAACGYCHYPDTSLRTSLGRHRHQLENQPLVVCCLVIARGYDDRHDSSVMSHARHTLYERKPATHGYFEQSQFGLAGGQAVIIFRPPDFADCQWFYWRYYHQCFVCFRRRSRLAGISAPAGKGEPKNLIPWDKLAECFNKNLK